MGAEAPLPAKYNADGSGRDTYIRRDPVECFGKQQYKTERIPITRMGEAGSHVQRLYGKKPGPLVGGPSGEAFAPVGGKNGESAFQRPARFLPPKAESYPVPVTRFSTMQQIVQNGFTGRGVELPGHGNNISGYQGFKPNCAPSNTGGDVGWATVSQGVAP